MKKYFITNSPENTENAGKKLAKRLTASDIVIFKGPFGCGKTTMVRGIIKHLTGENVITSPSFVILNEYNGKIPVYHFDLYRITNPGDIETTGYQDYTGKGLVLIEWPEKIIPLIKQKYIEVNIEYTSFKKRKINIKNEKTHN
ncbi:MAG: tRNA (adenosine(37)-N6)-threonylcarbamoyltransferase complex ATPase subunit type 1 TsaE [Candidatus Omnitrophica bacterium]|nr:tRNA (adenosine(37)-N6)-threonylcarbamoyltransferase complex ATPase subunit type 1 TsaE [Candidatus Omnitrophota bacterium]